MSSAARPVAATGLRGARRRDLILGGAALAVFVAGLVSLAAATGWSETLASLARISPAGVLLLLILSLTNYLCRALRWRLYTRALTMPTHFGRDVLHYLAGLAMTVTPGRIGELIRMRWLKRETGLGLHRTAPLILMDRAGDLAATAVLLAGALALAGAGIEGGLTVAALSLAAAFALTRPSVLRLAAEAGWRLTGRARRTFARLRSAASALAPFSRPPVFLAALLLGMAGWFAEGYSFYLLLGWMDAPLGLWTAVAIFLFATLAGGATGLPGGLGGAEAVMVALLSLRGVPLEVAVPATAVIRLTTLWFAIAIGMVLFPFAEGRARRQTGGNADAMED